MSIAVEGLSPRVRGTACSVSHSAFAIGLSPRVRGNRWVVPPSTQGRGSIPACAGEPPRGLLSVVHGGVYPRVCGGTRRKQKRAARRTGLSPRVRGNQLSDGKRGLLSRSIPACAGEPAVVYTANLDGQVYPRVCGGTCGRYSARASVTGLSPRVRGNPYFSPRPQAQHRSIPACAGEPRGRGRCAAGTAVYPRVCGGTCIIPAPCVTYTGLSPRVRGNRYARPAASAISGSIPACAGEPLRPKLPGDSLTVYPRVCGGTCTDVYPVDGRG